MPAPVYTTRFQLFLMIVASSFIFQMRTYLWSKYQLAVNVLQPGLESYFDQAMSLGCFHVFQTVPCGSLVCYSFYMQNICQILMQNQQFCIKMLPVSAKSHFIYNVQNTLSYIMDNTLKKSTKGSLPKLTIQETLENQQILHRINRKIDFKKNPRYQNKTINKFTDVVNQPHTLTNAANNEGPFRCDPPFVQFSDYKKDSMYEFEITLVNYSRMIRRVKISPLKTKEFTISNIKYPNSDTGDIAPGMAAKITVRFYPRSTSDFSDELIILSEGNIIKVPIVAKLEDQNINIPEVIDCGNCWVGDQLQTKYELINRGGQALLTLKNNNSVNTQDGLKINNFYISPSRIQLKKNERVTITAKYTPVEEGRREEIIQLLSDNGNSQTFKLIGTAYKAEVGLMQINNQQIHNEMQRNKVYFENVYPNEKKSAFIKIKNLATVNLKYKWKINNNSFTITPIKDQMKPMEEKIFCIDFISAETIPVFGQACFCLEDIPMESLKNRKYDKNAKNIEIEYYKFELITSVNLYQVSVQPQFYKFDSSLFAGAVYKRNFTIKNIYDSDIEYHIELMNISEGCESWVSGQPKGKLIRKSQSNIEINFRINNLDYLIKSASFRINLVNSEPIYLYLQGISKPPELGIETQYIDLGLIKIYGKASRTLTIKNNSPVELQYQIENRFEYHLPEYYQFYDYDQQDLERLQKRLLIEGNQGVLKAGEQQILRLTYFAKDKQTFENSIHIKVRNGKTEQIKVFIEVQEVYLILSKGYVNLKDIYVGNTYNVNNVLKSRNPLMLLNLGNIDAEYQWEQIEVNSFSAVITPVKGIVKAKSKQLIDIVLKPQRSVNLDYILKCLSPEVKSKIELHIQAQMKGLEIIYYELNEALAKKIKIKEIKQDMGRTKSKKITTLTYTSNLTSVKERQKIVYPNLSKIEFFNCEINKPRQIYIMLQNISDLNTQFELEALTYKSLEKEEVKQKTGLLATNALPFNSDMGKTLISTRILEKSQKSHLSNNKGISILCQPRKGQLNKNSEVKIKLTLFNDTCGHFQDTLRIKIKDHQIKDFPIDIDIRGTPVCVSKNQVGIDFTGEFPLFKLGAFIVNSGIVRRQFKVVNNGPKPVEVSWKIYSNDKRTDKDIFNIKIGQAGLGSSDVIKVNWEAIEPEEQKNSCFAIQPRNKTIGGREEASFIVSFNAEDKQSIRKCILVGEPVMVSGNDKIKMQLLTVNTQAQTVFPCLTMDVKHIHHITKFERLAGIQDHLKSQKTMILENNTDANLIFNFQIENEHFKLIETKTNSLNTAFNSSKTNLKSQVQKAFNLVPRSYVQIKISLEADEKKLDDWPLVNILRQEGKLNIFYSNGHLQSFPILGELLRPQVILNTTGVEGLEGQKVIDFGVVHTKNSKNLAINLSNISKVKAKWSLKYIKYPVKKSFEPVLWTMLDRQDQQIVDQKQCFQFSKTEGVLEALSVPIHLMPSTLALPSPQDEYCKTHKPQKIIINFKPKKNVLYKSKFKITIQQGEAVEFIIRGYGTYNEQKQI